MKLLKHIRNHEVVFQIDQVIEFNAAPCQLWHGYWLNIDNRMQIGYDSIHITYEQLKNWEEVPIIQKIGIE